VRPKKARKQTKQMVCPYRAVTGLVTAFLSIIYLQSTFADENDPNNSKRKEEKSKKNANMSPARRMALIVVLVLFHVDLFTTGYVRLGVKAGISTMLQVVQA
jgi:cell division protein FtsB